MRYNGIIENKLRIIEEKLNDIRSWDVRSYDQFIRNSMLISAVERALQVAIEVMIDISERILALEEVTPLDSAAGNIEKLQEMKIIRPLPEYANMVKFRNYIVHRYEKINPEIVYSIVQYKLPLFESFIEDIRKT